MRAISYIYNAMEDPRTAAARLIRWIMKVTGWNQTKLANEAGIAVSTIGRALDGESSGAPDMTTMLRLAAAGGAEITLAGPGYTPKAGLAQVDRDRLRRAVQIAIEELAREPNAAQKLPDTVIRAYEFLASLSTAPDDREGPR